MTAGCRVSALHGVVCIGMEYGPAAHQVSLEGG